MNGARSRTWISWGLALLLPALPAVGGEAAPPQVIGEDVEVVRLADGVWRHVSYEDVDGYGRVPANGLVVVSDGEAALLDTPWTNAQTRALVEWVKSTLDARLTTVVATHSHVDCMGGLGAAHELGARSYALDTTVAFAKRDGSPVPQRAFEHQHDLRLGARLLELRFLGPGHTLDNIVVWIPDTQVLFAGDVVRSAGARSLGNVREADLEHWPATLDALEHAYGAARVVVPGHGAPGGPELLQHTRGLLAAAR